MRKAEAVSIGARLRGSRKGHFSAGSRGAYTPRGVSGRAGDGVHVHDDTWELFRDDLFDRLRSDQELEAVVRRFARRSPTPYSDLLLRMLGMEQSDERAAETLFREVVEHRRRLVKALGRDVHVRVAALDLLTAKGARQGARRDSRPIVVTPSMLERAIEEATADAVTGLPQRTHFMGLLRHELRQRRRRGVAVAFIDLDGMKRVNDTYGHARGDDVLRALARAGRGVLRQGDVLARIGGDEFAVMLLDADEEAANTAVMRLRERFEAYTAPLGTSFSAGVVLAATRESAEDVLTRADAAMYREKRARAAAAG